MQSRRLSIFGHIACTDDDTDAKKILMAPHQRTWRDTRASPYHMAKQCPARSESLQPHTEWSSWSGSELPSVEADVYVWCYALPTAACQKRRRRIQDSTIQRYKFNNIKLSFRYTPANSHFSGKHLPELASCSFDFVFSPWQIKTYNVGQSPRWWSPCQI